MAGINWTRGNPQPDLVYLLRGDLLDSSGTRVQIRWCGPSRRLPSGLAMRDPDSTLTGPRASRPQAWEVRLSGMNLDATLGRLSQSVQAVSDLDVSVHLDGYDPVAQSVSALGDAVLVDLAINGRWANWPVVVWLLDRATGDVQEVFRGRWDRDPTAIGPGGFRLRAVATMYPLDEAVLGARFPTGETVPTEWSDSSSLVGVSEWWPVTYFAHPDHWGKAPGWIVGNGSGSADGVWREVIPYGVRTTLSGTYAYAWLSPVYRHFVHEVVYERAGSTLRTSPVAETAHQDRSDRGPMGSIVRFGIVLGAAYDFQFQVASQTPDRAWARCSGPLRGELGATPNWYAETGQFRRGIWDVLEDVIEDADYLGLSGVYGTNAISDFRVACPSSVAEYKSGLCALPREVGTASLSVREVLGAICSALPADLCFRWDPAVEAMRLFPLWRPTASGAPTHTIRRHHFASVDPPDVRQYDDPDGCYGSRFAVESPRFWDDPDTVSSQIDVERTRVADVVIGAEDGPGGWFGGTREQRLTWPHWLHDGATGFDEAVRILTGERGQKQRVVDAVLGVRGFACQMGDSIAYDVPGVWSGKGQIRGLRFDFDAVRVTVRSYHQDFYAVSQTGDHGRRRT